MTGIRTTARRRARRQRAAAALGRQRAASELASLAEAFGIELAPRRRFFGDPLDELVLRMSSANQHPLLLDGDHIPPADGNVFADLGFSPEESAALLADADARIAAAARK